MSDKKREGASGNGARAVMSKLLATFAACALGLLLLAPVASADYEQVKQGETFEHFGVSGEAEQLEEALGMAINESGEGGVQAGSVYVVGRNHFVLRFGPGEEGEEPTFREAWGWGVSNGAEEFQRCGPAYSAEPRPEHTFPTCGFSIGGYPGEERPGYFGTLAGVAVDQATGDVYVRNVPNAVRRNHLIEVFTATGEPIVNGSGEDGFGDAASTGPPPESIAASPEKLHYMFPTTAGIAVDNTGTVYLTDSDYVGVEPAQSRVMSFKPCSPNVYTSYCYATGEDLFVADREELSRVALVAGGRLVTATADGKVIREYPLEAGSPAALCSLSVSGQLQTMTANRATGEVFYFTHADRSIHRLGPCDEETEEFTEIQKIKPQPVTSYMRALAVNPGLAWGPLREAGTLYAADGEKHTSPTTQRGIGDVFAPAPILFPAVQSESFSNASTGSATLKAKIDPRGFETAYRFEYLSEAEYAARKAAAEGEGKSAEEAEEAAFATALRAPASDGHIGGGAAATVAAGVTRLAADTAYRFRVVAESRCEGPEEPPCRTVGEAASFATYPSAPAGLPDGRAYELVSPAQKHGGEVFPADPSTTSCTSSCKPPGNTPLEVFPMQSAPDGNSVAYMGYAFSSTEGAAVFNSYVSRRGAAGWQTAAMSPALLASSGAEHLTYDSSLTEGAIYQGNPQLTPSAPAGYANIYLEGAAGPGALTPLLTSPPLNREAGRLTLTYAGASPDYSCQLFAANDALAGATPFVPPDPGAEGSDLYESCGGQLRLVNVMPDGATVAASPSFASASPDAHGVSADGSRVFWQAGGKLYARVGGTQSIEVAAGEFLTANPQGTEVLLKSGRLYALNGAGAYEQVADLTEEEGGFLGVLGASEDLSKIYFADKAALGAAPEAGSCAAAPENTPAREEEREGRVPPGYGCNLYLYQAGAPTRFIATLLANDGNVNANSPLADWAALPGARTAEASPSGRYLAFGSATRLSGYDNVGPCEALESEAGPILAQAPCTEAFLYDSATGRLTCPSCNPSGEAPLGNSTLRRIKGGGPWLPQPRYLTDSGRLYFDSQDRLSPLDTNGRVEDVYEAEAQGVGSCARAGGCVTLISPGTGAVDSNFLAADPSGANVFFTTRERLVPKDDDELIDLYDAREGGGFPGETETQRAECQGEACQPSPAAPKELTPASSVFEGAGNFKPKQSRKCRKGKVRKHGKCVRKHKAHHKKHGSHRHKKRHHKRRHRRADRNRRAHR